MNRLVFFVLLALGIVQPASAVNYKINARHSQVMFTYNHMGFTNITGRFNQIDGTFDLDPANLKDAKIAITLPMSGLSTGVTALDEDLSSDGFFDVEKFPTASFTSEHVAVIDETHLDVTGALTIHGVTKPVTLAVIVNRLGEHPMYKVPAAGFEASATISRSDFGVGAMVPMVGDAVTLRITLEADAKP